MSMAELTVRRKAELRMDVLTILSGNHLAQNARMDDVMLGTALQRRMWQLGIKDVVTIVQEMKGRGWVAYQQCFEHGRVTLYEIEICPDGQDLVDGLTTHPAARS